MTDITGPVDFALIVFDGNDFNGDVAPALIDLQESGTVRVLDAAFVSKAEDGSAVFLEVRETSAGGVYADLQSGHLDMLSDDDLVSLADALEPNTSGLALVWENTWAGRFAEAVRGSNGAMVAFERIPHSSVLAALGADEAPAETESDTSREDS